MNDEAVSVTVRANGIYVEVHEDEFASARDHSQVRRYTSDEARKLAKELQAAATGVDGRTSE